MPFWGEILRGAFPDLSVLLMLLWMQDLPLTFHILTLEGKLTEISLHFWCWGAPPQAACLCLQGGG